MASGESKGSRRYDKENLLWQSTVAIRSDPVAPVRLADAVRGAGDDLARLRVFVSNRGVGIELSAEMLARELAVLRVLVLARRAIDDLARKAALGVVDFARLTSVRFNGSTLHLGRTFLLHSLANTIASLTKSNVIPVPFRICPTPPSDKIDITTSRGDLLFLRFN